MPVIIARVNRKKEIMRAIGVGLFACLGGFGVFGGYSASGGMYGWAEFAQGWSRRAFEGSALVFWGGAVAVWIVCVVALRAGFVGAVGALLAVVGSGVGMASAILLASGDGGEVLWIFVGVALWALGVAVMSWARIDAIAAKQPGALPRVF